MMFISAYVLCSFSFCWTVCSVLGGWPLFQLGDHMIRNEFSIPILILCFNLFAGMKQNSLCIIHSTDCVKMVIKLFKFVIFDI